MYEKKNGHTDILNVYILSINSTVSWINESDARNIRERNKDIQLSVEQCERFYRGNGKVSCMIGWRLTGRDGLLVRFQFPGHNRPTFSLGS